MKKIMWALSPETLERLADIQADPKKETIYYEDSDLRIGAIIGLFIFLGFIGYSLKNIMGGQNDGLLWMVFCSVIASWIGVASYRYLGHFKQSIIKPCVFITQLYAVKITVNEIEYFHLLNDYDDVKMTHNYNNGTYQNTTIALQFKNNEKISLTVKPKHKAETLMQEIQQTVQRLALTAENKMLGYLPDIFVAEKNKLDDSLQVFQRPGSFKTACVLGVFLAGMFFLGQQYYYQTRMLRNCHTPKDYEQFLQTQFLFNFKKKQAYAGLKESHKRQFEQARLTPIEVRQMMTQTKFPALTPEDAKEIQMLYQQEGKKRLEGFYRHVQENYRRRFASQNQEAVEAMEKILEAAKAGSYRASIQYTCTVESGGMSGTVNVEGMPVRMEPVSGSVVDYINRYGEQKVTSAVHDSFDGLTSKRLLEFSRTGDIQFRVYCTISPMDKVYADQVGEGHRRRTVYYAGIMLEWKVVIFVKGEIAYQFHHQSLPEPDFEVTEVKRSRNRVRNETRHLTGAEVYNTIIEKGWKDFSLRMEDLFGEAGK